MHGLGEIIRMNKRLGAPYGRAGRNGEGTPWRVHWPSNAQNIRETNPFRVVRASDGAILGEHPKLGLARRQVADLMKAQVQAAAKLVGGSNG